MLRPDLKSVIWFAAGALLVAYGPLGKFLRR